jgi:hypothetical protein
VFESLWSLWNLVKERWPWLLTPFGGLSAMTAHWWRYVELLALNLGWGVYPVLFICLLLIAWGVFILALMLRGDVGFRRVLLAQLKTIEAEEFQKIRDKYDKLVADVAVFLADRKQSEPIHTAFEPHSEWNKRAVDRQQHDQDSQARFFERFGPRIIELTIDLRRAGAAQRVTEAPLWAMHTWPEIYLRQIGAEIQRLSILYLYSTED